MPKEQNFISQYWYWYHNCDVISNERYLTQEAEKLFREIYIDESIPEGRLGFKTAFFIFEKSKTKLDEDLMLKYMADSVLFLNIVKVVYGSNISDEEKKNIVNVLLGKPANMIKLLESFKDKTYEFDDIIDLITSHTTDISTAVSGEKQYTEIDNFLAFANRIYGDKFKYTKGDKKVEKYYHSYLKIHALYANKNDLTNDEVVDYFSNNLTADSFRWALKALKTLRIDDDKKHFEIDDIIKVFENINMYSKEEKSCSFFLIYLMYEIKQNPEKYYLGSQLLAKFEEKYDYKRIIADYKSFDKSKRIDLSSYVIDIENPIDEDKNSLLTEEEEKELKEKFPIDIYKKIEYILKKPRPAKEETEEILISIDEKYFEDFVDFIESKKIKFFYSDYKAVYDFYKRFERVIKEKENLNEYLINHIQDTNITLFLRWLLILAPYNTQPFDFNDLLLLLKSKNIITLSSENFKKELLVIAKSPESYLYGEELIEYVKNYYKYDVYDEEHRDLNLSDFIYANRHQNHPISLTRPEGLNLIKDSYEKYIKFCPSKFKLKDVLVFAFVYEYHDEENDEYYALTKDEIKRFVKKVAKNKYNKEFNDDIDNLVNDYEDVQTKDIVELLKSAGSFDEILEILELRKELNGEVGALSQEELDKIDGNIKFRGFYTSKNYYSLMKFFEKIRFNSQKYAYSQEFIEYYENILSSKKSEIENLDPRIEKIEKKEDSDSLGYKIVNRFIPTSSEEKKRVLTATISGIGVVSLLAMTVVFAMSPIKAIESCASSFEGLLTNPSLADIRNIIGSPLLYFGAIYESIKGFTRGRFKYAAESAIDELKGLHR